LLAFCSQSPAGRAVLRNVRHRLYDTHTHLLFLRHNALLQRHDVGMKKLNTLIVASTLLLAAPGSALLAAPNSAQVGSPNSAQVESSNSSFMSPLNGQKCDNPGALRRANNSRFVCAPEGARNVWRRVERPATLSSIVAAIPGYSLLATALKQSGLDTALATAGPFTLFAPRNAAFLALPKAQLDYLLAPANVAVLRKVLLHHVVSGSVSSSSLQSGTYTTLNGTMITVRVGNQIRIDGTRVTFGDVAATNGLMHGITGVLVPSDVMIP
ncbi:MAG: hypothetical protein RL643_654, partial [Actinomycetota bacterium]